MFELTMAAFRASQIPAIVFEQPNEVANFHARIIRASLFPWKPHNARINRARTEPRNHPVLRIIAMPFALWLNELSGVIPPLTLLIIDSQE
jgi:hypothetical protein